MRALVTKRGPRCNESSAVCCPRRHSMGGEADTAAMVASVRRPNPQRGTGGHRHIRKRFLMWLLLRAPRPRQTLLKGQLPPNPVCPRAMHSAALGDGLGNQLARGRREICLMKVTSPPDCKEWTVTDTRREALPAGSCPEVWWKVLSLLGGCIAWQSGADYPPRNHGSLVISHVSLGNSVNILSLTVLIYTWGEIGLSSSCFCENIW